MELPPGSASKIMHATMAVAGGTILMSDAIMGNFQPMNGCNVMVSLPTDKEAAAAFARLSDGGKTKMPYGPTFWAKGFGIVTDRFGIHWMITTDEAP